MPITARLQMLGERLRDACAQRNWTALARGDAELASCWAASTPRR
ncbi:hypothetical protein ACFJIX_17610 [Roseateles sp. UC29_93]